MYKVFKIAFLVMFLSFFSQKMEANAYVNFYAVESAINQEVATISTDDFDYQILGLPDEIQYQFSNSNLKVNFSLTQKKIVNKYFSISLFKREQYFSDKIELLWKFCQKNKISFTTDKIIFPFHYFW